MEAVVVNAPLGPTHSGSRVEARNLGRRFGNLAALEGVDLEIDRGESYGLLGANGAGKTTFIRLTLGYLLASSGSVRVDDLSPTDQARAVQKRIGYVAETARLYPELSVIAFLEFAAGLRSLSGADRRDAVAGVIARFQLEEVARRPIGHLSKGFRQRVSLAQAFLHDPSLLIVDEPTSGLDPVQREHVRSALDQLRGTCTLILCTHDLGEARMLTDRVGVLHRGHLVAQGETERILDTEDPLALFHRAAAPHLVEPDP